MKNKWIIFSAFAVILVSLVVFRHKLFPTKITAYSAVFLTNGQVYFGELSEKGEYTNLKSVYYLQTVKNGSTSQLSLVHLGGEIHQPTDEMNISKSQILFLETLSITSPVIKAITAAGN